MSRIVLVNQSSTPDDAGSGNAQLFIEGNELYQQVGTGDKTKVANETTSTFTSPLSTPSVSAVNTCKAWGKFNGSGTPALDSSYNVSSITDTATGRYGVNFTINMDDADYCVVGQNGDDTAGINRNYHTSIHIQAAGSFEIDCFDGSAVDPDNVYFMVMDN